MAAARKRSASIRNLLKNAAPFLLFAAIVLSFIPVSAWSTDAPETTICLRQVAVEPHCGNARMPLNTWTLYPGGEYTFADGVTALHYIRSEADDSRGYEVPMICHLFMLRDGHVLVESYGGLSIGADLLERAYYDYRHWEGDGVFKGYWIAPEQD